VPTAKAINKREREARRLKTLAWEGRHSLCRRGRNHKTGNGTVKPPHDMLAVSWHGDTGRGWAEAVNGKKMGGTG